MKLFRSLILVLLFSACASSEEEEFTDAHYAAYAADGLTFHTPAPEHEDPRPIIFYYKYCTLSDDPGHFSPTSYDCDDRNQ